MWREVAVQGWEASAESASRSPLPSTPQLTPLPFPRAPRQLWPWWCARLCAGPAFRLQGLFLHLGPGQAQGVPGEGLPGARSMWLRPSGGEASWGQLGRTGWRTELGRGSVGPGRCPGGGDGRVAGMPGSPCPAPALVSGTTAMGANHRWLQELTTNDGFSRKRDVEEKHCRACPPFPSAEAWLGPLALVPLVRPQACTPP